MQYLSLLSEKNKIKNKTHRKTKETTNAYYIHCYKYVYTNLIIYVKKSYTVLSIKPYIASRNIVLQIQLCRRAVSIKKRQKKGNIYRKCV